MELQINKLPENMTEVLVLLSEESSEVIKNCQKVFRSGTEFKPWNGTQTNLDLLKEEVIDLQVIIDKFNEIFKIDPSSESYKLAKAVKIAKLKKWSNIF